jgi:hypothetical protein
VSNNQQISSQQLGHQPISSQQLGHQPISSQQLGHQPISSQQLRQAQQKRSSDPTNFPTNKDKKVSIFLNLTN